LAAGESAAVKKKHPPGLKILFLTEMWERFGFYCMLSILSLYMNETIENGGLGFSLDKTSDIYSWYISIVYLTPLFGGIIADRLFGIRRTIIFGGLFLMLGYFLLAFKSLIFFFTALACLIIGNGCFKPNISVILGNLYRDMPEKKDDAYNIFYMGINLGAFFSPLAAASLRNLHPIYGWHFAFAAAGVGMIVSVLTFAIYKKHILAGDNPNGANSSQLSKEVELTPAQEKKQVTALLVIFAVVIFFWMAFHQNGLTLTFWARDATRTTLNPEIFQAINPFFILAFTPLIVAFWNVLRRRSFEPSTAAKLGIGMVLTAACYGIMYFAAKAFAYNQAYPTAEMAASGNYGVSAAWLINAYAVITMGELCLSPMGLSLVSKLAPWKIRSMMMGGWFVSTAIGNKLSGVVGRYWDDWAYSTFFLVLVAATLFSAIVIFLLLKFLDPIIKSAEARSRAKANA